MKKFITLTILLNFFICYSQSISEDINNYDPSTTLSNPDVYSFEKVNISNIKKYVGKVDVSIPLYTIKSGGINYPILLNYDTGGIKVDQLSSDVGLGWSISQCVVTRKINMGNDFNTIGYKGLPGSGYSFGTQFEQDIDLSIKLNFKQQMGYFLNLTLGRKITNDERKIDFIPDEYNFYSSEFNTKFFFKELGKPYEFNPQGTNISAVKSKMQFDAKVPYINAATNQYDKYYDFPTEDFFTMGITSKNGIKYTFNDYDLATNIITDETLSTTPWHYANNKIINMNTIYVSAWHVSTIEDIQTGKKINFEYDTTHSNPFSDYNASNTNNSSLSNALKNAQRSFTYIKAFVDTNVGQCFYWTPYYSSQPYEINSRIDVQKKRLKRITFDEGSVEYKYNNDGGTVSGISNTREDMYNGDFLTQIIVKNNKGEIIKTIEFKYDYFISNYGVGEFNPDGYNNSKRYKRLKLKEVKEIGKPSYVFTYDESIKLPPVNSFSIDFLGYYNASPDITGISQLQSSSPNPKIYYYPNSFDKSVLPFPIPNQPVNMVNGYFDRQANQSAKAWSLIKIDYPTGGSAQYEYESNSFKLLNENILGGGIRVKKQTINDDYGNQRVIEYSYLDSNGKSSGSLATMPFFGHHSNKPFDVSVDDQAYPPVIYTNNPVVIDLVKWKLYDKSNLNKDIVSGSYVGYSRVTEREIGRGKTETFFTSNDDNGFQNRHYKFHPQAQMPFITIPASINNASSISTVSCMTDFLMANSAFYYDNFTDCGYKRGKLTFEKIYDESGQLLKMKEVTYSDNLYDSYNFLQPITYLIRTQGASNLGLIYKMVKKFEISNYFKTGEKIHNYSNGNDLTQETNYVFNSTGSLTSKTDILTNKTVQTKYYYPKDSQVSSEPLIGTLISNNLLGIPLKTEVYTNSIKTCESKIVYANDTTTSNLLLPKQSYAKKGDDINGILERQITKDLFDNRGNVIQYTSENGIPTSLIWGYNKTLLIAKIENISYSSVSSLAATAQSASDTQTEAQLITALNNIRTSLPNAMVTTYTHKPLVGVTSITDPKGDMTTYEYDSNGRLIKVKDKNGKILTENVYYFQP
ncbi:MAG TPA: RHS repeat protein [Flavobacterium sp.]|uniref:RHS repeat domain-containing protein n=1 Tax=Flavobacterium sp. TaxID=239 RepID=UPI002C0F38EB|nr:RHS repeat domain-containing protein [Flavobacterium sp.]HNP31806.1 RHS repeat protein [Flavobacterium sp.]